MEGIWHVEKNSWYINVALLSLFTFSCLVSTWNLLSDVYLDSWSIIMSWHYDAFILEIYPQHRVWWHLFFLSVNFSYFLLIHMNATWKHVCRTKKRKRIPPSESISMFFPFCLLIKLDDTCQFITNYTIYVKSFCFWYEDGK